MGFVGVAGANGDVFATLVPKIGSGLIRRRDDGDTDRPSPIALCC
jgi:hypothetical protein